MKKKSLFKYFVIVLIMNIAITSCNEEIWDFGYDGSISGKISDPSGNFVSGDPNVAGLEVHAFGEKDKIPMIMRVKEDGTYANIKLYPQSYKVWVSGPVFPTDTVVVDLKGGNAVAKDFVVTPFLTIAPPSLDGSPSATEIKVNYSITGNDGKTANLREIICSTVSWPNSTTGNGIYWTTIKVTIANNQGTATITGLVSGTKYFIRIGARDSGTTLFNYSDQLIVTTP